jgi:hypothetical protein
MLRDGRKEKSDNGVEVIAISRAINFEENRTGRMRHSEMTDSLLLPLSFPPSFRTMNVDALSRQRAPLDTSHDPGAESRGTSADQDTDDELKETGEHRGEEAGRRGAENVDRQGEGREGEEGSGARGDEAASATESFEHGRMPDEV